VALLHSSAANVAPVHLGNSDKTGSAIKSSSSAPFISPRADGGQCRAPPAQAMSAGLVAASIQTDAAINRGNSGVPMFDMNGDVIGIVSHMVSVSGGSQGLGFVVTSNMARRLLLEEPSVWHGLDGYLLSGGLAHALNLPTAGLLVQRVAHGSPAERLGLRGGRFGITIGDEQLLIGGDVIIAIEGYRSPTPMPTNACASACRSCARAAA
jgi:hypothetical protein